MVDKIALKLGAQDVAEIASEIASTSGVMDASQLDATLSASPETLAKAVLACEVVWESLAPPSRLFTGLVVRSETVDDKYYIQCQGPMQVFKEMPARDCFGNGLHHAEMIYFMVATTEGQRVEREGIHLDHEKTLADEEWRFRKRRYIACAPLPFCALEDADEVDLAGTRLYRANREGTQDDRNIAACLQNGVPDAWVDGRTMIRFYVTAEGFLDALGKAKDRIREVIDYLSFSANLSTPCFKISDRWIFTSYDRSRTLTRVQEADWIYLRDSFRADRYWLHGFPIHKPADPFRLTKDDPLLRSQPLFDSMLSTEPARLTSRQRALLSSVHALRESREAVSPLDSLVHLWNCVEFLLNGFHVRPMFTDSEKDAVIDGAVKALPSGAEGEVEKVARIKSVLRQQLNNRPLRSVWNAFCSEHNVLIHPDDNKHLWKLRQMRNFHQHGRSTEVQRSDLIRAQSVVEKVILVALNTQASS